jgi:lysophospholipase L1-like esterase
LLELSKRKQIQLVLINMPLSPEIAALAPPGAFPAYQAELHKAAAASGTTIIDFFDDEDFRSDMFKDGVHLSYDGATILANKLNDILVKEHPEVLEAMAKHAAARNHGGSGN